MRLGILFSGGKDSCFAAYRAMEHNEVVCLISIISENKESYMFHTPNIELVRVQAQAIGLPLVVGLTKGEKEEELDDLRRAIQKARREHNIEGIVTGAIASVYQASRIQKICSELELWCFNPLWQANQIEHMENIVKAGFDVVITGVFAQPLSHLLGKKINKAVIEELARLEKKHKINPAGEGGEMETFVLSGPIFKKKIIIKESDIGKEVYQIKEVELQ